MVVEQPGDGDERSLLLGWLAHHRAAFAEQCRGLTDEQLVERSVEPSVLTLLGLVRHLAEMERVYGSWANGPDRPLQFVWGEYVDGGPEWDFEVDTSMVGESWARWRTECASTDAAVAARSLDAAGANGRGLRWNLHKLVGEYAGHRGHAALLRERIDGTTSD